MKANAPKNSPFLPGLELYLSKAESITGEPILTNDENKTYMNTAEIEYDKEHVSDAITPQKIEIPTDITSIKSTFIES